MSGLALGLTLLGLAASPAAAIGAQGVDLEPALDRRDGIFTAPVLEDGSEVPFRVVNRAEETRTVTVSAHAVDRGADGQPTLGAPADWVAVAPAAPVVLAPGETRDMVGTVDLAGYRAAGTDDIALVLAIEGGGNVIAQAATIIQLTDGGAQIPLPVGLVVLAVALLASVGTAWVRVVRRDGLGAAVQPA